MSGPATFLIRPMTLDDLPQVSEIDREAFPTAWPLTAYRRELEENRLARYLVAVRRGPGAEPNPSRVAGGWWTWPRRLLKREEIAASELVTGFVGLWLLHGEAHITTIAVREAFRRRGIGERLLIATIDLALEHHQEVVTLECRVSNWPARALYEKYGFRVVGIRPRYYSDNNEDALIMTTDPITSAPYQALLQRRKAEHRGRFRELYEAPA